MGRKSFWDHVRKYTDSQQRPSQRATEDDLKIMMIGQRISRPFAEPMRKMMNVIACLTRKRPKESRAISRFFYSIFSDAFSRERVSALAGIERYWQEYGSARGNSATLRRNIHMIEKGMVMRPRRDVFALDYIAETIEAYEKRLRTQESGAAADPEICWAYRVLAAYFEITASHPKIDPLRTHFSALGNPAKLDDGRQMVPYTRRLHQPGPVAYDDLLSLAVRRRSVRWFLPKPVPRELIDKAMAVALQSPSACNRQPFVFHFFSDPEMVRKVAAVPMGTKGYGHNLPLIAVVVGQQRNFFSERDRHLIYIDGSLAAMSFCLALETLGLASCIINWPDIDEREREMGVLLNLSTDERPVMLIGLGFPDPEGMVPASIKKAVDDVVRYG